MSKYDSEICPFCDKPVAPDAIWVQASDLADDDPAFVALDKQFCWCGWAQPGECVGGMRVEERLIQVLEQRDVLWEQLNVATH